MDCKGKVRIRPWEDCSAQNWMTKSMGYGMDQMRCGFRSMADGSMLSVLRSGPVCTNAEASQGKVAFLFNPVCEGYGSAVLGTLVPAALHGQTKFGGLAGDFD